MTTDLAAPAPSDSSTAPRGRRHWLAAVVVVVVIALGVAWWSSRGEDVRAGTDSVTMAELAARHGVDVDLIAVTAANGLIEFRYVVVDPDKATRILHEPELAPTLVDEASGATLRMSSPPHKHGGELRLGGTYFFLMANADNALHKGSQVTLILGDARVEHLTVAG